LEYLPNLSLAVIGLLAGMSASVFFDRLGRSVSPKTNEVALGGDLPEIPDVESTEVAAVEDFQITLTKTTKMAMQLRFKFCQVAFFLHLGFHLEESPVSMSLKQRLVPGNEGHAALFWHDSEHLRLSSW
jgi:hypothetical protein